MSKKRNNKKDWDWESPFEELVTPEEIEQGYTQRDVDLILERRKAKKERSTSARVCPRGTKKVGNKCVPETTKRLHFTGRRYIYARSGEGIKTKGLLLTDGEFERAHERWKRSK